MDLAAATKLQDVRQKLQKGPWNTGELGTKGFVVTEPLAADQGSTDNIKRYTDRYLRHKTIGRTIDDYPFKPEFLPPELHRPVGLKRSSNTGNNASANPKDPNQAQTRLASVVSAVGRGDAPEDAEKADDEDGENENENDEAELEDEFDEMDDDDYNAEKYFDDGDDDDGDDGDNEAAY